MRPLEHISMSVEGNDLYRKMPETDYRLLYNDGFHFADEHQDPNLTIWIPRIPNIRDIGGNRRSAHYMVDYKNFRRDADDWIVSFNHPDSYQERRHIARSAASEHEVIDERICVAFDGYLYSRHELKPAKINDRSYFELDVGYTVQIYSQKLKQADEDNIQAALKPLLDLLEVPHRVGKNSAGLRGYLGIVKNDKQLRRLGPIRVVDTRTIFDEEDGLELQSYDPEYREATILRFYSEIHPKNRGSNR